jgi:hypothetical protein
MVVIPIQQGFGNEIHLVAEKIDGALLIALIEEVEGRRKKTMMGFLDKDQIEKLKEVL